MSAKKSYKSAGRALSYIILLLLVVALIGGVFYFTNGCTSGFQTFYITRAGKSIMERGSEELPGNTDTRFDVKYTFSIFNSGLKGYSVKVMPGVVPENDFEFTKDGQPCIFSGEQDLTSAFDIKLYDNYFTVNPQDNAYLGDVLSKVHDGKTIAAPEILITKGFLLLVVTSYNGQQSISVDLSVYHNVDKITLDKGGIKF